MKRKATGIVGAVVLAIFGTVLLVAYVQSAKNDAIAGEALVNVWRVKTTIEEGTKAEDIEDSLERTKVPVKVRAKGAIDDLDDIKGQVSSTDLVAGEQVVAGRFISPSEARQGEAPADHLQVTVELDPQRALGGRVRAGDTVAVLLSFEPFDVEGSDPEKPTKTSNVTHMELHDVVVVSVQIADDSDVPEVAGEGDSRRSSNDDAVSSAPTSTLLVTFALDAPSVEQLVFAAEFGTVWLAAEPPDAPENGTRQVTRGNVFSDTVIQ
jgi:pilus assembly protein CpaB